MASAGMVLALFALLPSEAKELVALPLSEDGVKPPAGLDAWKTVTSELKRGGGRHGMSTALQKKRHDFLIGPAREQARDCGQNAECLAEIGAALGADVLVAGTVDAKGVALIAIDVKGSKRIGAGRSSKRLAKASLKRKAASAARALVDDLAKPPLTAQVAREKEADPASSPIGKPPPARSPPAAGDDDLKVDDDLEGEQGSSEPIAAEGELRIAKDQLSGVTEVTVDGEALLFAGDGSMSWRGAPGNHTLVAVRAGGNRITKEVVIDPSKTTEVLLEFNTAAVPPPPPTERTTAEAEVKSEDEDVFTAWWFWTSLGAAVAAGATTAALLASGAKGGPSIEGDTGTIRGRY